MSDGASPARRAGREHAAIAGAGAYGALAGAIAALQPISNPDTFGHLAQGRAIARSLAEHGALPMRDPFSFRSATAQPWVNYEWLSDLATYAVQHALGYDALIAVSMALLAAGLLALVLLAGREGGARAAWITALLVTLAIPAARFRMSARPHLVTLPLCALYLLVLGAPGALATRRRAVATVGALGTLQIFWANLHGSHLLGIGIVAAAAIAALPDRARARALGAATLVVALASCVTPYGAALTRDAIAHVFDPAFRAIITEWHDFTNAGPVAMTALIATSLALAVVAPASLRAGPSQRTWWLVAAALAVAALRSMRFVGEALFVAAPLLAVVASRLLGARAPRLLSPGAGMGAATAVAAVSALATWAVDGEDIPLGAGVDPTLVPAEAAAHVERDLPGARVLASMPSSWYLLWAAPSARVLVDGRVPFYGAEHVRLATAALEHETMLMPVLDRFGADVVLVQHTAPNEVGALAALAHSPAFVRTWIDGSFAVYARRSAFPAVDVARVDALPASYDVAFVLGADDARAEDIRADLAHLGGGPASRAFAAFVRAMLRLRPLAREGGWAGYRPPATVREREAVSLAARELAETRREVGGLPIVLAHSALVLALECRLDDARAMLARARAEGGDVRETIFGQAEIDLRAGESERVRAFLAEARAIGGDDPWILAIEAEAESGLRCGGAR